MAIVQNNLLLSLIKILTVICEVKTNKIEWKRLQAIREIDHISTREENQTKRIFVYVDRFNGHVCRSIVAFY
jgi:hypothetical protein